MAELEDDEFEKLLLEKQHREMISSLRSLISTLEKVGHSDAVITRTIQQNSENIVRFIEKVTSQKPPEISLNQDQVIYEIQKLSAQMTAFTEDLKLLSSKFQQSIEHIQNKKPVEYEFIIDRDFGNRIEKVIAKPK